MLLTRNRFPVCGFPDHSVVSILLDVGSNVNAVDLERNTPLHTAARNDLRTKGVREVLGELLRAGAHLDARNGEGKTAVNILGGWERIREALGGDSPLKYVSLKCLAARKIVQSGINYKGQLPSRLDAFICLH